MDTDHAPTQRCGHCKQLKPIESFAPSYRGKAGTWCRACSTAYARGERGTAAQHEPRQCEQCGKDYVPRQLKANAAYCSQACKDKSRHGCRRDELLLRKYGISPAEYDRLLTAQDGGCAICEAKNAAGRWGVLHIDHNHITGKVRGLLCSSCNHGLGQFKDDPVVLRAAADYVEAHR